MTIDQFNRVFEIDFFKPIEGTENISAENIDFDKIYKQCGCNLELFDKEAKLQLAIIKTQSIWAEECMIHIKKIHEIFTLVNNSLLPNKDDLTDIVIDQIDIGFKNLKHPETKKESNLALDLEYAQSYRWAVLDVLYNIIRKAKDSKFEQIKKSIYSEMNFDKIIDYSENISSLCIDFDIETESDFYKMTAHLKNRLETLKNQKLLLCDTFVKPLPFDKQLIMELYKEKGFGYCIDSNGDLKSLTEITAYILENDITHEPNQYCWLYSKLLREQKLSSTEKLMLQDFLKQSAKMSLTKFITSIIENNTRAHAIKLIKSLKNKILLDLAIDHYIDYTYNGELYPFYTEFKPFYIELIDQSVINLSNNKDKIIDSIMFNSTIDLSNLYEQLSAPENDFIDTSEQNFIDIFKSPPCHDKPVKWKMSNRLLAYFFDQLYSKKHLDCESWQSIIDHCNMFINKKGKKINANDLAVAKHEYERWGNPIGYEIIDKILKTLIG